MKASTAKPIISFVVAHFLVGCSRESAEVKKLNDEVAKLKDEARQQQLAKEAVALQSTEIDGSVFIATRSGEIFKLALVPVVAVELEVFAKQVKDQRESMLAKIKKSSAEITETAKRAAILGTAYQGKLMNYNSAVSDFNKAGEELSSVATISREDRTIILNSGAGPLAKNRASAFNIARRALYVSGSALVAAYADVDECYQTDSKERLQYAFLLASASSQIVPLDFLPALTSSKSDGDGRFTISVKRPANVVLMAHSERETSNGTESYWWYVPVLGKPVDSAIKVMLSNDNVVSHLALLTPDEMAGPENLDRIPKPSTVSLDGDVAYQVSEALPPPTPEAVAATVASPSHEGPDVYNTSELDSLPVAKFQARPKFPFEMRRAGVSGEVLVDFIVDTNGEVQNAFAAQSSTREFEANAIEAVSKWKFRPGRKNGHAVFTHMQVPITFTLNEDN